MQPFIRALALLATRTGNLERMPFRFSDPISLTEIKAVRRFSRNLLESAKVELTMGHTGDFSRYLSDHRRAVNKPGHWALRNGKLLFHLAANASFVVAAIFAFAAFVFIRVTGIIVATMPIVALCVSHAVLPIYLRRGSDKARIVLGLLFVLEIVVALLSMAGEFLLLLRRLGWAASYGFTGGVFLVAQLGFCAYLLLCSGAVRAEVARRSMQRRHEEKVSWRTVVGFWLWVVLNYYFARWAMNWYIIAILHDPRWLSGRVSVGEKTLMGAITFVAAGIAPFIWFGFRRFRYTRAFGPLLLWTILVPVVVLIDYMTSEISPLRG